MFIELNDQRSNKTEDHIEAHVNISSNSLGFSFSTNEIFKIVVICHHLLLNSIFVTLLIIVDLYYKSSLSFEEKLELHDVEIFLGVQTMKLSIQKE